MILECPSCRARFMVQIGLFAQGPRLVRCARCQHGWEASMAAAGEVLLPVEDFLSIPSLLDKSHEILASFFKPDRPRKGPDPARDKTITELFAEIPEENPAEATAVRRSGRSKKRHKILFFVALAFILTLWVLFDREPIVKVLPVLRGFYNGIGLPVAPAWEGLLFDRVKSELKYDAGTMKLIVDGAIHNSTGETQLIPDIKARAIGPDGRIIQSWWVPPPEATIDAGGDVPFHTEVNAPMERTIEDINLEFYLRDDKDNAGK